MIVWNCMLWKGEEDIIDDWWAWSQDQFDVQLIIYNGSPKDIAFRLLCEKAEDSKGKIVLLRNEDPFTCQMRKQFIDVIEQVEEKPDWVYFLAADLWVYGSPSIDCAAADTQRATMINYDMVQFYPTKEELDSIETPVWVKLRHYLCNWDYTAAYKYDKRIDWPQVDAEPPFHPNPISMKKKEREYLMHYQFRSRKQIEDRLKTRKQAIQGGCKSFRHYPSMDSKDYVFDPLFLSVNKGGEVFAGKDKTKTLKWLVNKSRGK